MKNSILIPSVLVALALFFVGAVLLIKPVDTVNGAAFTGMASYQQLATTTTVGPDTKVKIFTEKTDGSCKARVITTRESQIFFLFADPITGDLSSTTLTRLNGHIQGASTTVAYDAGIYGCGRVWALGAATTSITVSEF